MLMRKIHKLWQSEKNNIEQKAKTERKTNVHLKCKSCSFINLLILIGKTVLFFLLSNNIEEAFFQNQLTNQLKQIIHTLCIFLHFSCLFYNNIHFGVRQLNTYNYLLFYHNNNNDKCNSMVRIQFTSNFI